MEVASKSSRDKLQQVARAIATDQQVTPKPGEADLVFVGLDQDPRTFAKRYRGLQEFFRLRFGVELAVVGGGVGCEKSYIKIFAKDRPTERRIVELVLQLEGSICIELERAGVDRIFENEIGNEGGLAVAVGSQPTSEAMLSSALKIKNPLPRLESLISASRSMLKELPDADGAKTAFFKCLDAFRSYFNGTSKTIPNGLSEELHDAYSSLRRRLPSFKAVFECILGTIETLGVKIQLEPPTSLKLTKTGIYHIK